MGCYLLCGYSVARIIVQKAVQKVLEDKGLFLIYLKRPLRVEAYSIVSITKAPFDESSGNRPRRPFLVVFGIVLYLCFWSVDTHHLPMAIRLVPQPLPPVLPRGGPPRFGIPPHYRCNLPQVFVGFGIKAIEKFSARAYLENSTRERPQIARHTRFFLERSEDRPCLDRAADIRARLGWSADDPVLLQIGQLSWVKGADRTIDIVEEVQRRRPDVKLLVVGSGPLMEHCESAARAQLKPGSFSFAGFVPSKETVPYYLASSLVMFPSRYETWARAVNEAMACRRCCVVTANVAAAGGLVDDGHNGHVVETLEPLPFAETIAGFLSLPPSQRSAMEEAARGRARRFGYEALAAALRRSFFEFHGNRLGKRPSWCNLIFRNSEIAGLIFVVMSMINDIWT